MLTQPAGRSMMKLIGIVGARGAGKSTIAKYLCERHGWTEMSFADPLKQGVMHMFGLRSEQVYDPDCKEIVDPFWGVSPRDLLQVVGTELMRERLALHFPQTAPVWIRALDRRLQEMDSDDKVVISDVRFPDEVQYVRERGGEIWYVVREGFGQDDAHVSERLAKAFSLCSSERSSRLAIDFGSADHVLTNDGDIAGLHDRIDRTV